VLKRTPLDSGWSFACPRWLARPGPAGNARWGWLPARVPGHVHLDLARHGIIAEPLAALGELGCQWVDEHTWSYRTKFGFRPEAALPRRVLVFDGLDTVASVSLNGRALGEHDNMFTPLELDVSDRLQRGDNELRIDFAPACRIGQERRARYLEREVLSTSVAHFDERAFVRKAQYMYGWDWGPRLLSAGIWRPVWLIEHAGRLLDVHVEQHHRSDGSVELRVSSELEGPGEAVHRIEGVERLVRDGDAVLIERPRRWWPSGLGEQPLYALTTWLVLPGTPEDQFDQRALDRRSTRIGLCRVELVRAPDRIGESFELSVNGRRIWCLGANWIPDHSFPSLVDRERLRARLAQARDLGSNMLRVWGGGLYESDDFYELCDELGLLVWQDFAYACSYYPDDELACEAARREAEHVVRRLRNHASIALYCGNNENSMMFHGRWEPRDAHLPRLFGEILYDRVLPGVVAALDRSRPYVPSSPFGGESPNDGRAGDQHCWDVWHGRGDWMHYDESVARFASEFGFASAPGQRAWHRALGRDADLSAIDPRDVRVRWHDKTGKDYERFSGLVELHYPPSANLEEWIYRSQLNQRDALRRAIEHYRRSDACRGALVWQLNDCWPVQSWALVDAAGCYKAAAYEMRRLFAPLLVALEIAGSELSVWTILDNATAELSGELVVEASSLLDGQLLRRWTIETRARPDERRVALTADLSPYAPAETLLCATFQGATAWRLLGEPKDARLAAPHLSARIEHGGLIVESDAPVVDLMLWNEAEELVFHDNLITLPRAGSIALRVTGPMPRRLCGRSLAGSHVIEAVARGKE
jgi:beta-mannosidase